jgi:aminotransferase in exopolysaccharide biosynthesis
LYCGGNSSKNDKVSSLRRETNMKNKVIPLSVPNLSLDILENIRETIETGWVSTGGRFIKEFEEKVAKYVGVERAVSTQSGTAGLHLALDVLGVGFGDEVIVPTLTFIAAVNPVRYVGAEPVFMDCDDNLNMDMDKLEEFLEKECEFIDGKVINKLTGKQVKSILAVHVFGNPLNIEKLIELRDRYNLKVIEDATEALGSYYLEGKYAGKHCGTIGDIGVYSFNANKIITTGGGGMVVCQDSELSEKVSFLSLQAKTDSLYFVHDEVGYNYRMTNIQAAFGTDQIDRLEGFIETKIKNYELYRKAIEKIDGLELLPFRKDTRANHWFYSVLVNKEKYGMDRDELLKKLNDNNIQTRPLWRLIHKQKPYLRNQGYKIEKAEFYEENLLNIPCSSNLTEEDILRVIEFFRGYGK